MFTKRAFKTIDEVEVTFEIDPPGVERVDWVSEHFDWKPIPMKRSDRGRGPFRLKIRLPKDHQVQFRYVFDGAAWENDEAADAYWPNEVGSDNSVISTAR